MSAVMNGQSLAGAMQEIDKVAVKRLENDFRVLIDMFDLSEALKDQGVESVDVAKAWTDLQNSVPELVKKYGKSAVSGVQLLDKKGMAQMPAPDLIQTWLRVQDGANTYYTDSMLVDLSASKPHYDGWEDKLQKREPLNFSLLSRFLDPKAADEDSNLVVEMELPDSVYKDLNNPVLSSLIPVQLPGSDEVIYISGRHVRYFMSKWHEPTFKFNGATVPASQAVVVYHGGERIGLIAKVSKPEVMQYLINSSEDLSTIIQAKGTVFSSAYELDMAPANIEPDPALDVLRDMEDPNRDDMENVSLDMPPSAEELEAELAAANGGQSWNTIAAAVPSIDEQKPDVVAESSAPAARPERIQLPDDVLAKLGRLPVRAEPDIAKVEQAPQVIAEAKNDSHIQESPSPEEPPHVPAANVQHEVVAEPAAEIAAPVQEHPDVLEPQAPAPAPAHGLAEPAASEPDDVGQGPEEGAHAAPEPEAHMATPHDQIPDAQWNGAPSNTFEGMDQDPFYHEERVLDTNEFDYPDQNHPAFYSGFDEEEKSRLVFDLGEPINSTAMNTEEYREALEQRIACAVSPEHVKAIVEQEAFETTKNTKVAKSQAEHASDVLSRVQANGPVSTLASYVVGRLFHRFGQSIWNRGHADAVQEQNRAMLNLDQLSKSVDPGDGSVGKFRRNAAMESLNQVGDSMGPLQPQSAPQAPQQPKSANPYEQPPQRFPANPAFVAQNAEKAFENLKPEHLVGKDGKVDEGWVASVREKLSEITEKLDFTHLSHQLVEQIKAMIEGISRMFDALYEAASNLFGKSRDAGSAPSM